MKNLITVKSFLFLLPFILLFSCSTLILQKTIRGEGQIVTKTIAFNEFSEVHVNNYCDVEIKIGSEFKVEVSDYENIIEFLEFNVVQGKLRIESTRKDAHASNSRAKAIIYIPQQLISLSINGSGNIQLLDPFKELQNIVIAGSGDIFSSATSSTHLLNISIAGSGDIDLSKIVSQDVNCSISGSGDVKVNAQKLLNVSISGSGDVHYLGNPSITKRIDGSGEVVSM
jgi:hypothetical protein